MIRSAQTRTNGNDRQPESALEFKPLPFLSNPHVQTVLGNLWPTKNPAITTRLRKTLVADGDCLVLHDSVPMNWRAGERTALLVHGLGGSHRSGYMLRVADMLLRRGLRVVRMDLRGCGRGAALARQTYNGGCSGDVRAAVAEIHKWDPTSPVTLLGFSLGGNIVLKLAGEAACQPLPLLERVAAVAPPIDLERCAELLALPGNRLYNFHYSRSLVDQVQRQQQHFPDLPRVRFPRRLTMRIFDELYTAPRGGFQDALDYYRRASSVSLIARITVPTLILTARDDPFIAVDSFERLQAPEHIAVTILRHGGHLGFLGPDGAGGIRWAERRVVDWVSPGGPPMDA
ncbi:MAG TPA: alpha/beta fold hydrolase [Gemmataceae bacterium]|nr:alpha/beta fold hydrolase [Gemmataceae bacterium]